MNQVYTYSVGRVDSDAFVVIAGIPLLIYLVGLVFFFRYLKNHPRAAVTGWLLALAMGMWNLSRCLRGPSPLDPSRRTDLDQVLWLAGNVLLPLFAVPLALKLYFKWLGRETTPEENAFGSAGVAAWLRGGNVVCCAGIALCAWQGFGQPLWGMLGLTVAIILAYPLLHTFMQTSPPTASNTEDLSSERERVLKLLEEGKITAAESAELLGALGSTVAPSASPPRSMSMARKIFLVGGGLLFLGFFLPWFSINLGAEVNQFAGKLQQTVPGIGGLNLNSLIPQVNTGTIRVSGGDLSHGLGWLVLLLGLGAAVIPFLNLKLDPFSQSTISLLALSIGGLVLLYLLTQNMRFASVGIVLTIVGYALLAMATFKERQTEAGI